MFNAVYGPDKSLLMYVERSFAAVLSAQYVLSNALKPFVMMCRGPLSVHVYGYYAYLCTLK